MQLPTLIQAGMGVAISSWRLARTVSSLGHLGVVSGVGIDGVTAARLQDGDPDESVREALSHFPDPAIASAVLEEYFIEGGRAEGEPYRRPAMGTATPRPERSALGVVGGFVEVWLAKNGHEGAVGINLLEKAQLSNLAVLYGALLAGVDVVLVGAGIPVRYPGVITAFIEHQAVSYPLDVLHASPSSKHVMHFDPAAVIPGMAAKLGTLPRPMFFPIISSNALALAMKKRADGPVDGFVVEYPIAGGHNAPPRVRGELNEHGEPVYGAKDLVDLEKLKKLGLPFWLAGGYGSHEGLLKAKQLGAEGIQVGTAFALCNESGMDPPLRQRVLDKVRHGQLKVRTDRLASPTGFPFKVVQLEGTASDQKNRDERRRVCDLGVLQQLYERDDGSLGYRCAAGPEDVFIKRGGAPEEAAGRLCLCNSLVATAGFPQHRRDGSVEQPLVTAGDDLPSAVQFLREGATSYSARDVIDALLGESSPGPSGSSSTRSRPELTPTHQ